MKKFSLSFFFLIILMLLEIQAEAQAVREIKLWPGQVPGSSKPKQVYKQSAETSIIKVTEVTDPLMEIYPATRPDGNPAPAMIICPGGGYAILALDLEGREIARWLNTKGITAFVLLYRVPQKMGGALQDAQRALRIVRSRAVEFHLNAGQIGIMGFSAGGSLSARLASRFADKLYEPVDAADTVSARPDFTALIYPAYLDSGMNHSLTPELKLASTRPFFIFQTSDDPYGNSALVMASALRYAKIPVELHFYPEGGHGYGLRPGKAVSSVWPLLLLTWLKTILP